MTSSDPPFKDSSSINHYLKEIRSSNGSHKLSSNMALSFLDLLHRNIIAFPSHDKEKANSIATLSNLTHFLPENSTGLSKYLCDYNFVAAIVNNAILNPFDDAPYSIINSLLKTDLVSFENLEVNAAAPGDIYKTFMSVLIKHPQIVENIPKRLQSTSRNLAPSSIEFVMLITMICAPIERTNYALKIFMIFCQENIFELINDIFEKSQFNANHTGVVAFPVSTKLYSIFNTCYIKAFAMILDNLASTTVDIHNNQLHQTILNTLVQSIKNFNHLNVGNSLGKYKDTSVLFHKLGFSKNPSAYIVSHFSFPVIFTVITFLIKPSVNRFKLKCKQQYLLVSSEAKRFPMNKMLFEISQLLHSHNAINNTKNTEIYHKYILYFDQIFALLASKALVYWEESHADSTGANDITAMLELLKLDMKFINSLLLHAKSFAPVQKKSLALSYGDIRNIESGFLRDNQYMNVMSSKDLNGFDELLIENLKFFIINERFNELSVGCLCYDDDPDFSTASSNFSMNSTNKSKLKKRIYMALSTNKTSILYRKISENQAFHNGNHMDLDTDNSHQIPIRSIKRIVINDDKSVSSGAVSISSSSVMEGYSKQRQNLGSVYQRFIRMGSGNRTTKISLINHENDAFFTFYIDNKHSSMLWIDSLMLLINKFNFANVTTETKSHMEKLFDIKRGMQFSSLKDIYAIESMNLPNTIFNFNINDVTIDNHKVDDKTMHEFLIQQLDDIKFDNFDKLIKRDFQNILSNEYSLDSKNSNGGDSFNNILKKSYRNELKRNKIKSPETFEDSSTLSSAIEEDEFDYSYDELAAIGSNFYYT
ncbi:hypothetical protein DASC09_032830 [Saccharomycopsis crataegensis]|uniref:PH domain-containing protein n=1 Tax=Saccharomycopsis crataegensis TaxID=43959 RepID=A0AAV5QM67_9ASCO|nr:hypothetical protein DASC09_032830 [Saccharomycopsis crataegensis]